MRFCFALAAAALLAGSPYINAQTAPIVDDDPNNPHLKAAQQLLDSNNPSGAADEYEAAVAADPKLAIAHYELGLLYAEKLSEPINSIYHLQRFLKLAPNSEHAPNARQLVSQESDAFAASLPNASPTVAQVNHLQTENAALKRQAEDAGRTISQLQAQLAQSGVPRSIPSDAAQPAPLTATPSVAVAATGNRAMPIGATNAATAADVAAVRTYTIVKGDSLWKIAHKMYPHDTKNGVEKIQDANKDAIGGKPLKIGQVLIIP